MEKITASEAESVTMMARVALRGRNSPLKACRSTRFPGRSVRRSRRMPSAQARETSDERRHAEHEIDARSHLLQPPEHHERKEDGDGACKQQGVAVPAFPLRLAEDGPRFHLLEPEQGEDGKEDHDHASENNPLSNRRPRDGQLDVGGKQPAETGRAEAARAESLRRAR